MKKETERKKERIINRMEKLDMNNNKNLLQNPLLKKRNKKERDDGFEHRTSEETA